MRGWIRRSWFSCKRFSERLCRSIDAPLTGWDRIGYLIHYFACRRCRVAKTQIVQLERTLDGLATTLVAAPRDEAALPVVELRPEFLHELKERLRKP